MKIESSTLLMSVEHQSESQFSTSTVFLSGSFGDLFNALRGGSHDSTPVAADPADPAPPGTDPATLMANIAGSRDLVAENDAQMRLKRLMEELLAALQALLIKVGQLPAGEPSQLASDYAAAVGDMQSASSPDWTRITLTQASESESLTVCTQGCVRTADGQEIRFDLQLEMSRETEYSRLSIDSGSLSRLTDPLVLNFPGSAVELSGTRIAFDLSGDAALEQLPLLEGGSGYLAFDRNGDGVINDGSELFGASSGNGFADLAQLDEDGNQWIDEGDTAYAQLLLWRPGADGGELCSLSDLGIGALCTQSVASPFSIKDSNGELLAQVQRSGVWLAETGQVGSLQHLDVAT